MKTATKTDQGDSRSFSMLRQVLEELTRKRLPPTPAHYAVIYRNLVAQSMGQQEELDAITCSELSLCAQLIDALRGNFLQNGWLSIQIDQLCAALEDKTFDTTQRIQRIESIIHSIALNTNRSMHEIQDFSSEINKMIQTLSAEIKNSLGNITTADESISGLNARLEGCASMEEARALIIELSREVEHLAGNLYHTRHALGESSHALELAAKQLEQSHARSIENARAAQHDALSGALNRTGLENALTLCPAGEASLILIDIDNFKAISEQTSLSVGEAVLAGVARTIQNHLRDGDLLARLGGEQFLVVLPTVKQPQTQYVADRLLAAVRKWNESDLPRAHDFRVRINGGMAAFTIHPTNSTDILRMAIEVAEHQLHKAKKAGPGRILPEGQS